MATNTAVPGAVNAVAEVLDTLRPQTNRWRVCDGRVQICGVLWIPIQQLAEPFRER